MTDATMHIIRVTVEVDGRRASSEIEVEGDETDPELDLPPGEGRPS